MSKKYRFIVLGLLIAAFLIVAVRYLQHTTIAVLEPRGIVAYKERQLIFFALLLSLVVVIPVFTLLFVFAWRYREGNTKAKYSPHLTGNRAAEALWWFIPSVLIVILSVVTWSSSHELDPYRPLASSVQPIDVQVVALNWKWLFIYPKQNIASVNILKFPVNTPVNFEITADAPMNSFWIPQLGGQIYAMPGMSTQLHLMASSIGSFYGSSANISGDGFAGMNFIAQSSSSATFNTWVQSIKETPQTLDKQAYEALEIPSKNNQVSYYSSTTNNLYDTILLKYLAPNVTPGQTMTNMPAMEM